MTKLTDLLRDLDSNLRADVVLVYRKMREAQSSHVPQRRPLAFSFLYLLSLFAKAGVRLWQVQDLRTFLRLLMNQKK